MLANSLESFKETEGLQHASTYSQVVQCNLYG